MVDASAKEFEKTKRSPADAEGEIKAVRRMLAGQTRQAEFLRSLFEHAPLSYQALDENGHILAVNPKWIQTFRYKPDDIINHPFTELLTPDSRSLFKEQFDCFLRTGEIHDAEFTLLCCDGTTIEVSFCGRQGIIEGEECIRLHCFLIDKTKQKQTESRLRDAKEHLELVLESANLGTWDHNFETNEVIRDERWARMLGYQPDELPSLVSAWQSIIHPDDIERTNRIARRHEAGLTPFFKVEHRMLTKSGEWRWILNFGKIIERDPMGKPIRAVGTHLDITDQKNAEEQQRKVEARLQEAQRVESLSLLAGGVAHDFNNLLQGIMGNASLALLDLPVFSTVRKRIEAIEQAARHATDLTRQMLAYSGKGAFVIQVQDLTGLIEEMLDIIKAAISKKIMLHLDLQNDLPPIEADITQIRQIILNLVANGSEAIGDHPGDIVISTGKTDIGPDGQPSNCPDNDGIFGTHVYFEVSDSGCGMAPETQSRIFDPFYSTKFTGRGLGLAAVMGIVRGHKGCIDVRSTPGEGSSFRVLLPPSDKPIEMIRESCETRFWTCKGTVLVADDEKVVRDVVRQMLERIGFKVVFAKDGHQAVCEYRRLWKKLDLVLLDMKMPRLNGEEALRLIMEINKDAKVIITSGYNEQDSIARLHNPHRSGFIQKPYRFNDFVEIIHTVMS
ncbi:MAG: PAS domain-containing protein [Planctomycetota bacterium]